MLEREQSDRRKFVIIFYDLTKEPTNYSQEKTATEVHQYFKIMMSVALFNHLFIACAPLTHHVRMSSYKLLFVFTNSIFVWSIYYLAVPTPVLFAQIFFSKMNLFRCFSLYKVIRWTTSFLIGKRRKFSPGCPRLPPSLWPRAGSQPPIAGYKKKGNQLGRNKNFN